MEGSMDLNLKATELRLGLPGTDEPAIANDKKRPLADKNIPAPPAAKSQIVGWPPVRSFRKNSIKKSTEGCGMYVKVSMDGAPYLRKIDLKVYEGYSELLEALQNMFNFSSTSERQYATTYEDKDGDWMLLGDVPWHMFVSSCNKLRIIKASEPKGLT